MPQTADELDRAAVRRVLAGDTDAFEGLVRRWRRPVIALAWRYCRDQGRAEDLAQDTFVRAFRGLPTWRGDAAFSTWLFTITANVCRSHLKRARPVEVPLDAHAATAASPARSAGTTAVEAAVHRAVGALPAKYREAVEVYYFMERDLAEAARCLRVPDGTLKARLHRARALLRRRLSGILGEDTA
jgi:RNA polymerase sigma-70 factor (ECF subfamily)